jgi:hypothetical protein
MTEKSRPVIALLNTHLSGGAGIAARYISRQFEKAGFKVYLLFRYGTSGAANEIQVSEEVSGIAARLFAERSHVFYNNWSFRSVPAAAFLKALPEKPDFLFMHWVAEFCTPKTAVVLAQELEIPLVYFMADNAVLSGGCHYTGACLRYTTGCGQCPQLHRAFPLPADRSKIQFLAKQRAFKKHPPYVIAGSLWQRLMLDQSPLPLAGRYQCLMGSEPVPGGRHSSTGGKNLVWAANSVYEERKGFPFFLNVLQHLAHQHPGVCGDLRVSVIGTGATGISYPAGIKVEAYERMPLDAFHAMFINNDVFFNGVTDDAGPSTLFLALSAAMVIVSTPVGAGLNLVVPGENGIHVSIDDPAGAAYALAGLLQLSPAGFSAASQASLAMYRAELDPDRQFEKLSAIMREIQSDFTSKRQR